MKRIVTLTALCLTVQAHAAINKPQFTPANRSAECGPSLAPGALRQQVRTELQVELVKFRAVLNSLAFRNPEGPTPEMELSLNDLREQLEDMVAALTQSLDAVDRLPVHKLLELRTPADQAPDLRARAETLCAVTESEAAPNVAAPAAAGARCREVRRIFGEQEDLHVPGAGNWSSRDAMMIDQMGTTTGYKR